jgi:hypothetical protein
VNLWSAGVIARIRRLVVPSGLLYLFYPCGCWAMFTGVAPGERVPEYCPDHGARP